MQYGIVYTRLAKSDIGEIVTYISETLKAPKAAHNIGISFRKIDKSTWKISVCSSGLYYKQNA